MAARIACQWVRNQSTVTQFLRSKSGSLAMFAAILLASSRVSNFDQSKIDIAKDAIHDVVEELEAKAKSV